MCSQLGQHAASLRAAASEGVHRSGSTCAQQRQSMSGPEVHASKLSEGIVPIAQSYAATAVDLELEIQQPDNDACGITAAASTADGRRSLELYSGRLVKRVSPPETTIECQHELVMAVALLPELVPVTDLSTTGQLTHLSA